MKATVVFIIFLSLVEGSCCASEGNSTSYSLHKAFFHGTIGLAQSMSGSIIGYIGVCSLSQKSNFAQTTRYTIADCLKRYYQQAQRQGYKQALFDNQLHKGSVRFSPCITIPLCLLTISTASFCLAYSSISAAQKSFKKAQGLLG